MAVSSQDILAFLNQMPPEMKQEAIKNIEALRGVTITEYKAQRIEAAELLLADARANPDDYTPYFIDEKYAELIGDFKISNKLIREFGLVKWFISQRNIELTHKDGKVDKPHANLTFEEFMKTKKPL